MITLRRPIKFVALGVAMALVITGFGSIMPQPTAAQGGATPDGFTIFGGINPEYRLGYFIDNNFPYSSDARYYLEISGQKIERDTISLEIDYPTEFTELQGRFDENDIELRTGKFRGGEVIPTAAITWYEDEARIEIIPEEPIPEGTSVVVVLSSVTNPRRYGYHYFNLRMMYQGSVINQYVGTWPLEVAAASTRDN
jgi:hypothetical protein